jgi:hypothetical protein
MKDASPLVDRDRTADTSTVSELARELEVIWQQLDALGDEPLSVDELQRESRDDRE